jgi:hypothetical protein
MGNADSDAKPKAVAALSAVKVMRDFNADPSPARAFPPKYTRKPGPFFGRDLYPQGQVTRVPSVSAMSFGTRIVL